MRNLKSSVVFPPFIALAVVALYLHLHWNDLPQHFPMHWGLSGKPNGWASRSWRGVYGPLLYAGCLDSFLVSLALVISLATPKTVMQFITVQGLQFLLYPVTFSFILLTPLVNSPLWAIPGVLLASIVALLYWAYVRMRAESEHRVTSPNIYSAWKGGVFYWNPGDPAVFVPKRIGIGYTLNFANWRSWIVLIALLAAILVPLFFMSSRRGT